MGRSTDPCEERAWKAASGARKEPTLSSCAVLHCWSRNQPAEPPMSEHEQRRLQNPGQHRENQRASDDDDGQRFLRLSADGVRKRCGKKTECCHQRRHQHRAESLLSCVPCSLLEG